ncbi:unnamed protein product [Caenorhabditis angaria]|uniref:F-box domain-containing protein n=1 Tax=Caenorhabditis angaria TaxID=860376 RepID=A0A9P1J5K1_9PELO|nr:unnamed protein product [Caenorhabditis angaria]
MVATRRKRAETKKLWRLACKASRFIAILNKPKMKRFEEIPIEVRSVIVDKMRVEDRCRFARCSRLCENLAKSSIFYMYGLAFSSQNSTKYTITVQHHQYEQRGLPASFNSKDYKIEFEQRGRNKHMRIKTPNKTLLYPLPKNTNLLEAAVEKFEKLVNDNAKCIRLLEIWGDQLNGRQFNFNKIIHLETLTMEYLNPALLRSIQRPLKKLYLGESPEEVTIDSLNLFSQINQVQTLLVGSVNFTFEQVLQLTADRITVLIEEWNAQDIFNLLIHWKNHNDPRKRSFSLAVRRCAVQMNRQLISLLNLRIENQNTARVRLCAGSFDGKSAKLQFLGDGIFFAYPYDAYDLVRDEDFPHVDFVRVI